jgi:hypothetical protein
LWRPFSGSPLAPRAEEARMQRKLDSESPRVTIELPSVGEQASEPTTPFPGSLLRYTSHSCLPAGQKSLELWFSVGPLFLYSPPFLSTPLRRSTFPPPCRSSSVVVNLNYKLLPSHQRVWVGTSVCKGDVSVKQVSNLFWPHQGLSYFGSMNFRFLKVDLES